MSDLLARYNSVMAVLLAGALAGVIFLTISLAGSLIARQRRVQRRVERVASADKEKDQRPRPKSASVALSGAHSSIGWFDRAIKHWLPRPEKLRDRLAATGRRISLGEYILVSLLVAMVANLLLNAVASFGPLTALLFSLAAGLALPNMIVKFMIARRMSKFMVQFPEAIDLMVRGIRSGLPITESIKNIGQELPDPVGLEFRRIIDSFKIGFTLDEALLAALKRLQCPEFHFFIISLAVQQETGGNLAETLENLGSILRRRKQMKLKIRAMSSEARASAIIVGALPVIAFFGLLMFKPDYMMPMLTDHRGHLFLASAIVSMLLGAGSMMKLARFEI